MDISFYNGNDFKKGANEKQGHLQVSVETLCNAQTRTCCYFYLTFQFHLKQFYIVC